MKLAIALPRRHPGVYLLTHSNLLLRALASDNEPASGSVLILSYTAMFFYLAGRLVKRWGY